MPNQLFLPFFAPAAEKKYGRDKLVGALSSARAALAKAPLRQPSVVTAVYGSDKTQIFVNGENVGTTEMGLGTAMGPGWDAIMGATNTNGRGYFTGLISELMVFQGTMPDEQRTALEKSLAEKYSISSK